MPKPPRESTVDLLLACRDYLQELLNEDLLENWKDLLDEVTGGDLFDETALHLYQDIGGTWNGEDYSPDNPELADRIFYGVLYACGIDELKPLIDEMKKHWTGYWVDPQLR